ncbi:MAG TPA: HD-GYP domain-containing protein [Candidatus Dormibacteraeota bacterium]
MKVENRPQEREASGAKEKRWRSHPLLSKALRLLVVLAPAVAAAAVGIVVSRWLPVPHGGAGLITWWGVFLGATVVTWLVCATIIQGLLPLATLLDLTLLFPDAAPSRFAMLRRSANPRHLERELRRTQETGSDAEPGRRAQIILELAAALSIHDSRTRGHSERVRMFTDLLAQEMRLPQSDADRLRWAALLHDIGKLAVPPHVLTKPSAPDHEEWVALHGHPIEGDRLTAPLREWLGAWADTVRHHHERFDGTGYPQGLKGQAISLGGRIVAVADSYETMTAARPYKKAMSVTAARRELVQMSGSHFDPVVVRAFLNISLGRLWRAIGFSAMLAEIPFLAPIGWRLSEAGPRLLSALAAASVTVALIFAGAAGPSSVSQPKEDASAAVPGVQVPVEPGLPAAPESGPVPPAHVPPVHLPTTTGSVPGPGQPAAASTPAAPSSNVAVVTFPAGISRHLPGLPRGIAKNPNALAGWRRHH